LQDNLRQEAVAWGWGVKLIKIFTKFFIKKEIQNGSGAKSYMRKGFLHEEMRKYLTIYKEAVSHI
jgi:hypothetical protein